MAVVKVDKIYMQLNAAELDAIIKKDSPSSSDRDAGFCSASSESEGGDDLALEHAHDGSLILPRKDQGGDREKSNFLVRNKRKSMEPSKVVESILTPTNSSSYSITTSCIADIGPLKKRIRYTSSADSAVILTPPALASPPHISHSSLSTTLSHVWESSQVMPNPAQIFLRHPGVTTLHRAFTFSTQPEQQEPLALVARKLTSTEAEIKEQKVHSAKKTPCKKSPKMPSEDQDDGNISKDNHNDVQFRPQQRNYKNMTRERRIEANARERTRVHTISAAYETLRRAVPAYASSQKLSKLSVLRVACSYILTLSRMAGEDYSSDQTKPTIADCIDAISSTIQTEGKVKRKKDE